MAGVSREYVSRVESGKVALTEEIKGKFTDALEKLNPENPLEMVLDYVRIRFPTQDIEGKQPLFTLTQKGGEKL